MPSSFQQTILITGGAGFVGSHLCEALWKRGAKLVCLDNLSTGSLANLQSLLGQERFTFIEGDVCMPVDIAVDQIYHLASPASPVHYQSDPVQTVRTNVLGAFHLLDLARATGARIVQASTSEVYGDPLEHPQRESYWGHVNPIGVRSCYDEGKRCAETLFFDYHRQYGVNIGVARIFNTFGPRMQISDGRVVSNFAVQALAGEPITIYGDGSQTRSFCFVSDLVEGLIQLMEHPTAPTGPINLGNPVEFTIYELAQLLIQMTNSPSPIHFHPLPADDPKQRRPDIALARNLLSWAPQIPLEEGLRHTLAYFRTLLCREDLSSV